MAIDVWNSGMAGLLLEGTCDSGTQRSWQKRPWGLSLPIISICFMRRFMNGCSAGALDLPQVTSHDYICSMSVTDFGVKYYAIQKWWRPIIRNTHSRKPLIMFARTNLAIGKPRSGAWKIRQSKTRLRPPNPERCKKLGRKPQVIYYMRQTFELDAEEKLRTSAWWSGLNRLPRWSTCSNTIPNRRSVKIFYQRKRWLRI